MAFRGAAVLIMAIGGLTSSLLAQSAQQPPFASPLTIDEIIAVAQEAHPGTIVEFAMDRFEGKVVIDIEILNADGEEIEFKIDAQTGDILDVWTDDDPSDDPGPGDVENIED